MNYDEIVSQLKVYFGMQLQLLLSRSIKYGLMDVELELIEISNRQEIINVCSDKEFIEAFMKEHSNQITEKFYKGE